MAEKKVTLAFKEKDFFETRPEKILALNKEITPLLNDLHEVNHSEKFWLRLLSLHLRSCIGQKPFLEQIDVKPKIPFSTINSFTLITTKKIVIDYLLYIGRAIKYRTNLKNLLYKLKNNSIICLGLRGQLIANHKNGVFIESFYPLQGLLFPDLDARKRLKTAAASTTNIFVKNVLLSLPRVYVEYFEYFYALIPVQNPQEKSFHYEHAGGVFNDYILAKYQEAGSKVVAYQTGGYMGEIKNHPDEVRYSLFDELRTYGWRQNEKDVPDKAYRLIEYKSSWEAFKPNHCKFDLLLVFTTKNEVTSGHYDSFVKHFFQNIDKSKYPNLIVRPRPLSKYVNNKRAAYGLNIPSSVEVDKGKDSMAKTAADAKLVVQTWMPSTNFLECLSVDQAVVAVDTNNRPSTVYKECAKGLYKLGVLHESTESLVSFLNRLESIDKWWNNVLKEESYQEFKRMFCGAR